MADKTTTDTDAPVPERHGMAWAELHQAKREASYWRGQVQYAEATIAETKRNLDYSLRRLAEWEAALKLVDRVDAYCGGEGGEAIVTAIGELVEAGLEAKGF